MRVCPKCGYKEKVFWRNSRFDFNAEYIRFDEAKHIPELHEVWKQLLAAKNFEPVEQDGYYYYRRGSGGLYLYRVLKEDYRVQRERKNHT